MDDHHGPQPEPSDEALVARVVERDLTAFSSLYDRYAQPVYALAAHMLGSADAEEVVQEVFLRLWNKAAQFDGERGRFGAWFMAVARNYALDELKRRGQQQRVVAAEKIDQLLAEAADPAVDVEEEAWERQRGDAVLRALQNLPPEQRRVVVLAYFGGLSHTSIAQHLGWPLGTVKKRVRLGLQKLRASLAEEGLTMEAPAEPAPSSTE